MSSRRQRNPNEPADLRSFERDLNAMLAAAAASDPDGFAAIVRLLDAAATAGVRDAAQQLRQPNGSTPGYSWADIARALGVTKSAAAQRFSRRTVS